MVLKRNQNIVLIGFMGSGKTKTGKLLAKKLKMEFIDIDARIIKKEGKSIQALFREKGEPYFRKRETQMLRKACARKGIVLSPGGGAVLREENVRMFKKSGVVVWLKAKPETIVTRVGNAKNRPLLSFKGDKEKAVRRLLAYRLPHYRAASDIAVATDGRTPEDVAEVVMKRVRGLERARVQEKK